MFVGLRRLTPSLFARPACAAAAAARPPTLAMSTTADDADDDAAFAAGVVANLLELRGKVANLSAAAGRARP